MLSLSLLYYLRQEVICFHLYLSVCLFVSLSVTRISQNVLDRFAFKFVEGLDIDQGPTPGHFENIIL